eukprot:Selendium_serpulae@DN5745_c2_g1_i2.p1
MLVNDVTRNESEFFATGDPACGPPVSTLPPKLESKKETGQTGAEMGVIIGASLAGLSVLSALAGGLVWVFVFRRKDSDEEMARDVHSQVDAQLLRDALDGYLRRREKRLFTARRHHEYEPPHAHCRPVLPGPAESERATAQRRATPLDATHCDPSLAIRSSTDCVDFSLTV